MEVMIILVYGIHSNTELLALPESESAIKYQTSKPSDMTLVLFAPTLGRNSEKPSPDPSNGELRLNQRNIVHCDVRGGRLVGVTSSTTGLGLPDYLVLPGANSN